MGIDLSGVQPVNQARRPTRTKKQEAQVRHQSVAAVKTKDGTENLHFGLGTVSEDIIEQQILKGLGKWCPENTAQIPLAELKQNAETLAKTLGSKPSVPTPRTVLGENFPTPYSLYTAESGDVDYLSINSVDLSSTATAIDFNSYRSDPNREPVEVEEKKYALDLTHPAAQKKHRTSIANFANSVIENTVEKNHFYKDRADAYRAYFKKMDSALSEAIKQGEIYNKQIQKYQIDKRVSDAATALYRAQLAYESSMTDSHRRAIEQDERIKELEALVNKPKRKRRTKAEIEAAKE